MGDEAPDPVVQEVAEPDRDHRMYSLLPKNGAKLARVLKHKIPSPMPLGMTAASVYTWNFQGHFNTFKHKADAKWAEWRSPSVASGTYLQPPKPDELFNVGAAKVPHHDPEDLIAPPKPTAADKSSAKEARRNQVDAIGEEAVKQLEATAAAEKAVQMVLDSRMHQLRGLAVRIARHAHGNAYGWDIAEPTSAQMKEMNKKIREVMPSAPEITPAQALCWLFHSQPLNVLSSVTIKTEFYYEEMRDYQSACVDMMQMLMLEGRFAQLPEPEREAVEVLQRVLRSAHDPGFGLFDPSTRVMVPELEKLGAYLPPSIEKMSVPLSSDAGCDDLIELSTIATQLFKATYSMLKFILKKVKKILLEAHGDLSTAPQKRALSKKARAWHDGEMQEKDDKITELNTKVEELVLKVSSLEAAAGGGGGRSHGGSAAGGSAAGRTVEVEARCKRAFAKLSVTSLKAALGAVYGSTSGGVAALREELVSAIMSGRKAS